MIKHSIRGVDTLLTVLIKLGYQQRIKIKNRYGAWFLLDPFNYIDRVVLKEGYYESEILECVLSKINPDDVFWDIGANIGLHSITLNHLRKDVQIFAFEPFPSTMNCLLVNAELNQAPVNKVAVGLSGRSNLSTIHSIKGNSGMTTIIPWHEFKFDDKVCIATYSIDDLVQQHCMPEPSIIKIDTEGSELDIIRGAQKLLEGGNLHTIIFEAENDFLTKPSILRSLLTSYSFKLSSLNREENSAHSLSNFMAFRSKSENTSILDNNC
ncbi:FkbM family methyltransferase [Flavihumibacter sp. R14]|nr:FkbM family methyltransferase [Flavihumibacter soli]